MKLKAYASCIEFANGEKTMTFDLSSVETMEATKLPRAAIIVTFKGLNKRGEQDIIWCSKLEPVEELTFHDVAARSLWYARKVVKAVAVLLYQFTV